MEKKGISCSPALPGVPLLTPEDAGISRPPALQRRSSYHRRHVQIPPPTFTAVPAGNCSLRKGPPPLYPSSLQIRNYISQKPKQRTQENYSSQESPGSAHARLFPSCWGRSQGRAEFGFSSPRLGLVSLFCPVIGDSAGPPPSLLVKSPSLSLPGEWPTPTSSREEGPEFRVVAQS